MKLSEKILGLRKKEGWSQEELAFKLDISRQAVYKWEAGESKPEIEKIKMLAKVFNVSFDYLMNDDIDSPDRPVKKSGARKVFATGIVADDTLPDIDSGVCEKRKVEARMTDLGDRRAVAEKAIKAVGGTDITFMQPNAATAYFYIKDKKAIGFYYAGGVQFVCPIENIVSFNITGGEQSMYNTKQRRLTGVLGSVVGIGVGSSNGVAVNQNPYVNTVLTYTEDGDVKEFNMCFSANTRTLLLEVYDHPEMYDTMRQNLVEGIKTILSKVQGKIHALRDQGLIINTNGESVDAIDYELIRQNNKETAKEYATWISKIEPQAKEDNKKKLKKKLIKWGLIAGGVLVGFIVLIAVILGM